MKTTNFSIIKVVMPEDTNDVEVFVKVPGQHSVSFGMTPDELMMFIVELSNGLATSRKQELLELQQLELKREQRRGQ